METDFVTVDGDRYKSTYPWPEGVLDNLGWFVEHIDPVKLFPFAPSLTRLGDLEAGDPQTATYVPAYAVPFLPTFGGPADPRTPFDAAYPPAFLAYATGYIDPVCGVEYVPVVPLGPQDCWATWVQGQWYRFYVRDPDWGDPEYFDEELFDFDWARQRNHWLDQYANPPQSESEADAIRVRWNGRSWTVIDYVHS